jgi:hypothetical protein
MPHRFTDREVDIVRRNRDLLPVDPNLEQTPVDVDERRPSKKLDDLARQAVHEIEEEVGLAPIGE